MRDYFRLMHAICFSFMTALVVGKIFWLDVWQNDPDFRGGFAIFWVVYLTAMTVFYVSLKISAPLQSEAHRFTKRRMILNPWQTFVLSYLFLSLFAVFIILQQRYLHDLAFERLSIFYLGIAAMLGLSRRDIRSGGLRATVCILLLFIFSISISIVSIWMVKSYQFPSLISIHAYVSLAHTFSASSLFLLPLLLAAFWGIYRR